MRVLWLCNIMLPAFAKKHGYEYTNREGWLSGMYERIVREGDTQQEAGEASSRGLLLGVCFPVGPELGNFREEQDGVTFYGFQENLNAPEVYDESLGIRFREILDEFQPDLIHIFGTEFPHTLAMIRAYGKPERTLLGIQGLCSAIGEEYMAQLPELIQMQRTFRDRYREDSLVQQQEKFRKRGEYETEAIRLSGHITGRTQFDRNAVKKINPDAMYHFMNETMRSNFYTEESWDLGSAKPHTIFMAQGDYPLKGLHFVLEALPEILEKYPDAHLYVAGNCITGKVDRSTVTKQDDKSSEHGKSRVPLFIRISAYGRYLRFLISKGKLKKHVTFLGKLNAEQMKEQYLRCSVFVCASVLENSPNSVGEAMLLGVPTVASRVGGIPDMITEDKDGLLFESGNAQELVKDIEQIWEEPVIASVYGANARRHAKVTHDPDVNYARLCEIYRALK